MDKSTWGKKKLPQFGEGGRPTSEEKYGKRLRGEAAKKAIALGLSTDLDTYNKQIASRPTSQEKYGGKGFDEAKAFKANNPTKKMKYGGRTKRRK